MSFVRMCSGGGDSGRNDSLHSYYYARNLPKSTAASWVENTFVPAKIWFIVTVGTGVNARTEINISFNPFTGENYINTNNYYYSQDGGATWTLKSDGLHRFQVTQSGSTYTITFTGAQSSQSALPTCFRATAQ